MANGSSRRVGGLRSPAAAGRGRGVGDDTADRPASVATEDGSRTPTEGTGAVRRRMTPPEETAGAFVVMRFLFVMVQSGTRSATHSVYLPSY